MQLPHLASRLYGTPLLVARPKLDILLSVLGERIHWPLQPLSSTDLQAGGYPPQAGLAPLLSRTQANAPPGIAVIPVYGTLVRRSMALDAASGLTSYGEISAMINAALADPAVTGILLDVDSPGGEAGGVFDLARQIRAADAQKPVWAIASDSAYSAAYAIACSASRVYVTQTGGVGSIGVIAMHVDQSARDAQEGYRYTAITAGDQKNDYSPHQALDSQALARLQSEVDRLYGLFVDHVAGMRRLEPRFVRSTQAGVYFGPDAVTAGLADAQASPADVLADFATFLALPRQGQSRPSGSAMAAAPSNTSLFTNLQEKSMSANTEDPTQTTYPDSKAPEDCEEQATAPTTTQPSSPSSSPTTTSATTAATAAVDTQNTPSEASASASVSAALKEAVAAAREDAVAVAELCQLAGQPHRIAAFLAEGASESLVRKSLLASRAQSPEITSVIDPNASAHSGGDASPERNPLMQAVKKLTGKD